MEKVNNNHMIAEFMGLTWEDKTLIAPHGSESEIHYKVYNDGTNKEILHLKYDSSWDWLIPVVNKLFNNIDSIENDFINKPTFDLKIDLELIGNFHAMNWFIINNDIDSCYDLIIETIILYKKYKNEHK